MTAVLSPERAYEAATREEARRHLKDFARMCWRSVDDDGQPVEGFIEGQHLDRIIAKLEAVERGEINRLIIEMPPRHGKSEIVSRTFPAWFLGRNPDSEVILASYGQVLANKMSRAARENFREFACPTFGVEMADDSASIENWRVKDRRGGFKATSIGGALTGHGARVFIIDDYVKEAEDAMSELIRDKNWDWFDSVAMTRLTPNGAMVVMATRWHHDDLIGRLLGNEETQGVKWERLRLPLMAEEGDPMGREVGKALWPEFGFDDEWAEKTRKRTNPWVWAALWQQRPTLDEGGMFQRQDLRYYREVPGDMPSLVLKRYGDTEQHEIFAKADTRCFIKVDLATSLKELADYTVVSVFRATAYGDLLVEDVHRQRIEGPDQADLVESIWRSSGAVSVGVEKMGYQLSLIQELTRRGVPVEGVAPKGDKRERAIPASIRFKSHKVFVRENASWRREFEDELLSFPLGEHDDQVDTLAYAAMDVYPTSNSRGFRSGGISRVDER